ncbi:MAG: hypothetical protein EPN98_21670 [Phenylobacterium sp.]|uniref:hypothetical protein n=1 Tax=Phenylobacterium sp. TaxID=1871053 RepID=UPI0012083D85|nr:hypothetical protein [Phenylobacterium sp.]TAL29054.1 MAG: hypothetical protein EPN98_21670 [Phenylobacterium sp.]
MSHSVVLVLIPASTPTALVEDTVRDALAPFDENLEVPEHDEECYCVGRIAKDAGEAFACAQVGTWNALRASFAAKFPLPAGKHDFDLGETENDARRQAWAAHISDHQAIARQHAEAHPLAGKPDPECTDCSGGGTNKTTSNPRAKWDWFTIGGRWTGMLSGRDPADDPDNWEPCELCLGTPGKRNDTLGRGARAKDPNYGCNGCRPEKPGLKMKWRLKQDPGDVAPVSSFVSNGHVEKKDQIPFAILERDGTWSERGDMHWFGVVVGEKPRDEWKDAAEAILARNLDALAVVVDVHI